MSDPIGTFSDTVLREVVHMLCGEHLGSGMGRDVFVCRTDPTKVVKVDNTSRSFQNQLEWLTWEQLQCTAHARWLAPCRFISPCGTALVMDRTEHLPTRRRPARMPLWLSDFKVANYGLLKGRVVCHDYGTNLLLNHGAFRKGTRRVDWSAT